MVDIHQPPHLLDSIPETPNRGLTGSCISVEQWGNQTEESSQHPEPPKSRLLLQPLSTFLPPSHPPQLLQTDFTLSPHLETLVYKCVQRLSSLWRTRRSWLDVYAALIKTQERKRTVWLHGQSLREDLLLQWCFTLSYRRCLSHPHLEERNGQKRVNRRSDFKKLLETFI